MDYICFKSVNMKKFVITSLVLFVALKLSAQISFIGFGQAICSSPMTNTYTYSNYTIPNGSWNTIGGFKIYRNGIQIYDTSGTYGGVGGQSCADLIFINDSTGFAVDATTNQGDKVMKTSNYGNTWKNIGNAPSNYVGIYVFNANIVYLVTTPPSSRLFVSRCSDIVPPILSFINDNMVSTDIYITDTIIGYSPCNIDSFNISVENGAGDTVDYHINLFRAPLGVNVNELPRSLSGYNVYPNPAQNTLYIKGDEFSTAEIYNAQGAKIYEENSKTINVEAFSKGIYFIRIIDRGGKSYKSEFIKE